MTVDSIFGTGLLIIFALAAFSVWRVRREYHQRDTLRRSTVVAVWLLYLLQLGLACYLSWMSYWSIPLAQEVAYVSGTAVVISGLAIMLAAMIEFRSMRRISGRQVDRLVTSGIYRWSRHPQNVGWALVMFGIAIAGQSGAALLLAALFCIMFLGYVPTEERYLQRVFGDEYLRYRDNVPRIIGPRKH